MKGILQQKINILFTSVGRRSYLLEYFKKSLDGNGKIFASNSSKESPAFLVADEYVVTPLIYDTEYIPFLLMYCEKNDIDAIISLFDVDLMILARYKEAFAKIGTRVIVSDEEVIDVCNDKYRTFEYLRDNDFNVPKSFLSYNYAETALKNNLTTFPLIVKPRWGMGSIGVFEAENIEELKVLYNKVSRQIEKTYLKYESYKDIDRAVIIQEKLEGQEYGLDVVNDLNGNYKTTICKIKYEMRAGETDCAMTVYSKRLKEVGERLSRLLKHVANLDIDVFVSKDKIYILEMNARFGGGYPFSHMAGVDLPSAIVAWLKGMQEPKNSLQEEVNVKSRKDIRMVRLK